jgi:GNAT superfamily N-acetyltransferase
MEAHMHLAIRVATCADHGWLRDLNRLAYEDVVRRQFGTWDDPAQRERFDSSLEHAAFRIVELDQEPIAAVWSEERDDHVWLQELQVLPEFQSQGIGSEILSLEVARAETFNKPVRLHVLVQSRARDFYRKNGFVETGRDEVFVDMESYPRPVTGGV